MTLAGALHFLDSHLTCVVGGGPSSLPRPCSGGRHGGGRGRAAARQCRRGGDDAVRIFTGAPMPAGCDTVMVQEDCTTEGDHVRIRPRLERGANRRRAGEDLRAGTIVLRRGIRLPTVALPSP